MANIREKSRVAMQKMQTIERGANKVILTAKESPLLREFREFAMRGNMIDLAIGIMIGGGFNKIVTSLVNDVIMPPIGLLVGRVDFSNLFFSLSGGDYPTVAAAKAAGAPTLNYGLFLNNVIDFLILAFTVFLVVRQINKMRRAPAPPEPNTKECPFCVSSIPLRASRCPQCTSPLPA